MKIEVTRAFYLAGGKPQAVGTRLEVDDRQARELIHLGKARAATDAPAVTSPAAAEADPAPDSKSSKGRK